MSVIRAMERSYGGRGGVGSVMLSKGWDIDMGQGHSRQSRDHEVMRPVCLERKQGDGGKG